MYNFRCWYDKDFTQLSDVDDVKDLPVGNYYEVRQYLTEEDSWSVSKLIILSEPKLGGNTINYTTLRYDKGEIPYDLFKVLPIDAQCSLDGIPF